MRHRKSFNHLGRKSPHRKAMLANMATSLILNKRIKTTTAKAKALRPYVEPLITKSKEDSTHSRREVFSHLKNKYAVNELFREISTKVADRPGGYTRILKTGKRLGDNADMCIIELVDYNEAMLSSVQIETSKANRRSRRSGGGKKKHPANDTQNNIETEIVEKVDIDTIEDKDLNELGVTNFQPEILEKYRNKIVAYNKSKNMKTISDIGNEDYGYNVRIFIDDKGENHLVKGQKYSLEIELKIDDHLKRKELLNTFSVYFYTNRFDITRHDSFHKFNFEKDNVANCKLNITPYISGETEFSLDFFQNSKIFYQKKFNVNIISPEYAL